MKNLKSAITHLGLVTAMALIIVCENSMPSFAQFIPVWNPQVEQEPPADWLVKPIATKAGVYSSADKKDIILYNGLLKRSSLITPNVACFDFVNLQNQRQLLRSVKPEGRVTINNEIYNIGGLYGQKENAYLISGELDNFKAGANDFKFDRYKVSAIKPVINWKSEGWWAGNKQQATGKTITFVYTSPPVKGLIMLYNPLKQNITRTIDMPLYYTGLTKMATFSELGKTKTVVKLNRDYSAKLTFTINAESYTWFLVE